jgi:hypothetical protein
LTAKRIVYSGLQGTEKIIVNGLQRVRPGMDRNGTGRSGQQRRSSGREALIHLAGNRSGIPPRQTHRIRFMNFSHFFIRRPIFAGVLSIVVFIVGLIAMWRLPISEYPEVVPPTIVVRATYPGANSKTIAETVASPLEQAINGVEGSLYMFSQATGDGVMTLTVTFQTRHGHRQGPGAGAEPRLAVVAEAARRVRRLGVTTTKQSPDLTMVVHLFSPSGRYDEVYLRNYATLQVKKCWPASPAPAPWRVFGSGDYAMRSGLTPTKSRPEISRPATSSTRFASRTSRSPRGRLASNRSASRWTSSCRSTPRAG